MATDQSKHIDQHTAPQQPDTPAAIERELPLADQGPITAIPEQRITLEGAPEREGVGIEESGGFSEAIEGITAKLRKPKKKHANLDTVHIVRDELTKEVEHIMEEGLKDAFKELSPTEAQAFKIKGEETAREIRQLLKSTKVKIKKIFQLLFEWLKLLPGINTFFLEQEAKIKADKIMTLHRRQMAERAFYLKK